MDFSLKHLAAATLMFASLSSFTTAAHANITPQQNAVILKTFSDASVTNFRAFLGSLAKSDVAKTADLGPAIGAFLDNDLRLAGSTPALDQAFGDIATSGAQALIVMPDPFFTPNREKLATFASERNLPSMFFFGQFADAGGLMSYGASQEAAMRQAAGYVDRILKGANPGTIAVYRAEKPELVVNLKTAKKMKLILPPELVRRADRVIPE